MLCSGSDSLSPVHSHIEPQETVIYGNRVFGSVLTEASTLGKLRQAYWVKVALHTTHGVLARGQLFRTTQGKGA